jgi:hypothetical protein
LLLRHLLQCKAITATACPCCMPLNHEFKAAASLLQACICCLACSMHSQQQ